MTFVTQNENAEKVIGKTIKDIVDIDKYGTKVVIEFTDGSKLVFIAEPVGYENSSVNCEYLDKQ